MIINKYFKFYCIILQKGNIFYPVQIEYYNIFTCYLFNTGLFTIFKTFKEANKYKNTILEWKRLKKLSMGFEQFNYITIAEIKQANFFKKPIEEIEKVKNEITDYNKINK